MLNTNNAQTKSFWKRPEGVTGTIFLVALAILAFVFWGTIVGWVALVLQNTLTAILSLVGIGIVLYVLLDPQMRTLVWYMYKSAMRWITGLFVQIDPIGILENYVAYLYKNLSEMDNHIAKLKGQMAKMKAVMDKNKAEMGEAMRVAEVAKKQGKMELVTINTRQFGRLKEANERYDVLFKKMEVLYKVLSKIHKNSGYLIQDIENEVRLRKQEREAIQAGHSAMRRAMGIIKGDPDKKMVFDMAMESIVDDVSTKIGEMERFIEVSGSFIDSVDLQNGVYEQDGLALLEKMEKDGGLSFLLADIESSTPASNQAAANKDKGKDIGSVSDYSDLFN